MASKPKFTLEPHKSQQRYSKTVVKSCIVCRYSVLTVCCVILLTLTGAAKGKDWHDSYGGHGTTHEQLGQEHYPHAELTKYNSKVRYSYKTNDTSWAIEPAYNVSQFIFDNIITDIPSLPHGYLQVKNGTTLQLGPKYEDSDYASLLGKYWLIFFWVILLVFLIIIVPFIAVCYCCFCCCRRCPMGCAPCNKARDLRNSYIWGGFLLLLVILLLLGAIIGFTSNKELDRGFAESKNTIVRSSEDTCRFLRDISEHIQHIYILNYEELEAHLTDLLNNAYNHIFLDLTDTSESNALDELERIFDNMPEAKVLMRQVDNLDKDFRYLISQLRDGVRGVKRDVNFACSNLMNPIRCQEFLKTSEMEFIDTSPCLHIDKLPDPALYLGGINQIINDDDVFIPKRALLRVKEIGTQIESAMSLVTPPMIKDISRGREKFELEANKVRNIINAVISDIQLRTLRSTQSFDDVYETFSRKRSYINAAVCALIFLVVIILIPALICGCFLSKRTGATFLFITIILAFSIFSFIAMVGLCYFILGLITYQGACAPLRDQDANAMFRELDSSIDLNRLMPIKEGRPAGGYPEMRMSQAIKACMANQSIFDLLSANNFYNLDDLNTITIFTEREDYAGEDLIFDDDLSTVFLLTAEDRAQLDKALNSDLANYHSIMFTEHMCKELTPNLNALSKGLRSIRDFIYYNDKWDDLSRYARYSLSNEAYNMDVYNAEWSNKLHNVMAKMKEKLLRIDELILYENRNFKNTLEVLIKAIDRSELFIRTRGSDYINALAENLTDVVNEQVYDFIQHLISESSTDVGRCAPLAYIYYRGVDLLCYRLVDPLNGYWVGILPAALLLLPLILVAHKLMCLWRRLSAYAVPIVVLPIIGGCPTCTGAAYVPPAVITCSGGQQTRSDGGATGPIHDGSDASIASVADHHSKQTEATDAMEMDVPQAASSSPLAKSKRD